MNLNDTKIVVAIENAVCDQLEASGIKADPFRLDGEKIVQVIIDQLGDYVVVPKEPTPKMIDAGMDGFCFPLDNGRFCKHDLIFAYRAMLEAQEQK